MVLSGWHCLNKSCNKIFWVYARLNKESAMRMDVTQRRPDTLEIPCCPHCASRSFEPHFPDYWLVDRKAAKALIEDFAKLKIKEFTSNFTPELQRWVDRAKALLQPKETTT